MAGGGRGGWHASAVPAVVSSTVQEEQAHECVMFMPRGVCMGGYRYMCLCVCGGAGAGGKLQVHVCVIFMPKGVCVCVYYRYMYVHNYRYMYVCV